ncbi:Wall-associated protein precursor [Archangium gephyra]|uniref:Wall-associated protein n=1 Tax=Archangium gephyra TaxID=48 RepID=A0AAC8Q5F9_9BACT|nr:Wall-associated protein precursor [Archangium gephyra]AKJ01331.1 Wall-associated protein precursor [Archangium gephyra]
MVRINSKALVLWMALVLASLGSAAASSPVYLAQLTCLNTMDCCIRKEPLTAAQRCGASSSEIAEALNGVKVLHEATQPEAATLKEEASEQESAQAGEASEASDEPSECTGQKHHIISRPIAEELEKHATLRGLYKPRDERFVTRAKDKESHCGYQKWHRDVDNEVIQWLKEEVKATPSQFEQLLREIYARPNMRRRFPHGF